MVPKIRLILISVREKARPYVDKYSLLQSFSREAPSFVGNWLWEGGMELSVMECVRCGGSALWIAREPFAQLIQNTLVTQDEDALTGLRYNSAYSHC